MAGSASIHVHGLHLTLRNQAIRRTDETDETPKADSIALELPEKLGFQDLEIPRSQAKMLLVEVEFLS